jgi:hypothetical protein
VKTPFTTHGSLYRGNIYCASFLAVLKRIRRLARLSNYIPVEKSYKRCARVIRIPYLMIQPRVDNTEYKTLLLNGQAKLIISKQYGFKSPVRDIFLFTERVTAQLKQRYPETMTEYIIRVDLFEVDGKLKVNEFESFDAEILMARSASKRKFNDNGMTRDWCDERSIAFVTNFWVSKFHELIGLAKASRCKLTNIENLGIL